VTAGFGLTTDRQARFTSENANGCPAMGRCESKEER
jgi:hypothetical protein